MPLSKILIFSILSVIDELNLPPNIANNFKMAQALQFRFGSLDDVQKQRQ
jgi:hypothetical protein